MNSRITILLVATAILLAVLMPVVFIATVLLFIVPTLLITRRIAYPLSDAQPLALRTLVDFRAPPAIRVSARSHSSYVAGGTVSLKKLLGKVLLFGVLEAGALMGAPITPEKIEEIMEMMNRVQVVRVIHKERDGRVGPL